MLDLAVIGLLGSFKLARLRLLPKLDEEPSAVVRVFCGGFDASVVVAPPKFRPPKLGAVVLLGKSELGAASEPPKDREGVAEGVVDVALKPNVVLAG